MLLLGCAVIIGFIVLGLQDTLAKELYLQDPAWRAAVRRDTEAQDFTESNRLEDAARKKQLVPSLLVALFVAGIAVGIGLLASQEHEVPFLYLLITGLIPGYLICGGLKRLRLRPMANASTPVSE